MALPKIEAGSALEVCVVELTEPPLLWITIDILGEAEELEPAGVAGDEGLEPTTPPLAYPYGVSVTLGVGYPYGMVIPPGLAVGTLAALGTVKSLIA